MCRISVTHIQLVKMNFNLFLIIIRIRIYREIQKFINFILRLAFPV